MTWFCYILRSTTRNRTYVGSTNNPVRRLRQHNGEISGGAKSTKGDTWEMFILISGFIDHINCLQCEWKMKHIKKYKGIIGRTKLLNELFTLEQWTKNSTCLNKDQLFEIQIVQDKYDLIKELPENVSLSVKDDNNLKS
jgi:structure-specific endonuclease subunit SLX1